MVLGNLGSYIKRMKLEHFLTLLKKKKLKWIKNLNIRPETIKFLEENIGRILFHINPSDIFFGSVYTKAKETKAKINN